MSQRLQEWWEKVKEFLERTSLMLWNILPFLFPGEVSILSFLDNQSLKINPYWTREIAAVDPMYPWWFSTEICILFLNKKDSCLLKIPFASSGQRSSVEICFLPRLLGTLNHKRNPIETSLNQNADWFTDVRVLCMEYSNTEWGMGWRVGREK